MTAPKSQSWDDFKREAFGGRTEVIEGVAVPVPTEVPLLLEDLLAGLGPHSSIDDFAEVVDLLFGEGIFDQWKRAGMGSTGLLTAITWGAAQGSGNDITFLEAYQLSLSDDPGKALGQRQNRAARRSRSASTGGPSKPTSRASTATTKRASRA